MFNVRSARGHFGINAQNYVNVTLNFTDSLTARRVFCRLQLFTAKRVRGATLLRVHLRHYRNFNDRPRQIERCRHLMPARTICHHLNRGPMERIVLN